MRCGVWQATEDVQKGVTQEDIDVFYEVWSQFDAKATEYMPLEALSEFVDRLDEPLRLPAPNTVKLITLDIHRQHEYSSRRLSWR